MKKRKYWIKCKNVKTSEIEVVAIQATNLAEAFKRIEKDMPEYIPLEYAGWED